MRNQVLRREAHEKRRLDFAFGIWVGINERFDQAHLHAHINLVGLASLVLFGLLYRSFPALATSKLAAAHFILFNLGAVVS
jgi:hypothetical protein